VGAATRPSLRLERTFLREGYAVLAGMDEVGRGALAGPVSVGVVLIDAATKSAPVGVRDSKLLTPAAREALVRPVRRWALAYAVGHASPDEIDEFGIMIGLRLAGTRALHSVRHEFGLVPDLVILDGNHDWLTDPAQEGLLAFADPLVEPASTPLTPPVRTVIKGDRSCSSVAAASILAKVERDAMLVDLAPEHPAYRWDLNKGYAAPEHLRALSELGPCAHHRRSWRLPLQGSRSDLLLDPDAVVLADTEAAYAGDVLAGWVDGS
jgi:ribonuclease HII